MSRRFSVLAIAAIAIVAAAAGALAARAWFGQTQDLQGSLVKATLLDPPRELPEFLLVDHENRPYRRAELADGWHLVFFGFTNCPDVCPNTLTVLANTADALDDLPPEQQPRIVLVSVDPERDSPEKLADYVNFFGDRITGVTGSDTAIATVTTALGVPVAKVPVEGGGYTVDHGAAVFLIAPGARLRALFSMPHEAAVIARDYRQIVSSG